MSLLSTGAERWVIIAKLRTSAGSTFCKFCAENGFPSVLIYWKRVEREDGSTSWAPCEDVERNIRHTHRHLDAKPVTEKKFHVEDVAEKEVSAGNHQEALSENEIMHVLLEVHDLSQKQNHLLKSLLENLGHLP